MNDEELADKINARCQKIAREFSEMYDDEAPLHERLLANFARHLAAHLLNSLSVKEACKWIWIPVGEKGMGRWERSCTSLPSYGPKENFCPKCGNEIEEITRGPNAER